MADLIVTAPLVIAKRADGSDVYLYEGVSFPEGLRDGEAERLQEAGLIGSLDDADDKKPARKTAASK
jgi:hypothetical protein